MGGGLMQLVAYGAQDIYLTGSPQITFFKVVYRRHTNFSMESIEQTFSGSVNFGRKVTCTISRNGDLLTKAYLQVTLPDLGNTPDKPIPDEETAAKYIRWVDHVGHRVIKTVEVEIGGQRIDKHYGEWLHIWNELTQSSGHAVGYHRMVGQHASFQRPVADGVDANGRTVYKIPSQTMYVPLQFWFNRNPGLALPLIALQYHEVKFNFEFASLEELCPAAAQGYDYRATVSGQDLKATLYVDYIYLDADERKRFAQVTHEYLIEQLQFTGAESIGSTADDGHHKHKLNFNHPVKELIWTVKPNMDDDLAATAKLASAMNPFEYTVESEHAGASAGALAALIYGRANPIKEGILQLNGHDRFSKRDGMYFNLVQPYQHHENIPSAGINVYSFALKPEEHQPSGSCNMSRIDNAVLNLKYRALPKGAQVSIYATNYNVLRVLSGMGGLAYAS